jgi:uncharacterized protein
MSKAKRWLAGGAAVALGGGLLALAYARIHEPQAVRLDRYTVKSDRPELPPAGLTILHLSDFHFRAGGALQARKIARLLDLLRDEHYDVLALTGDLIHDWAGLPVALDLIRRLRPAHGAFFCPGNHDYAEYSVWGVFGHTWHEGEDVTIVRDTRPLLLRGLDAAQRIGDFVLKVARNDLVRLPVAFNDMSALRTELAGCGVETLVNSAVPLRVGDRDIWFAGVDDLLEGRPDPAAALRDAPAAAPLVLLAHNPDVWLDPAFRRANLVLSGHTHGGQIKLPLLGVAHTQGTHLTRQQPAGWFERDGQRMFVIRGLGESIPLRFGVHPQAALIRWLPRT